MFRIYLVEFEDRPAYLPQHRSTSANPCSHIW